jgi:hypothetical protein
LFTIYNLNMLSSIVSVAVLALAALPSSLAAPAITIGKGKFFQCPVTTAPVLPTNQTTIAFDKAIPVQFVALGVGFQNYTCSAAGTYASAGAVATLYDVSCLVKTPFFKTLPDLAMKLGGAAQRSKISSEVGKALGATPLSLGEHHFALKDDGVSIAPVFDYTKSQGKSTFVVAAKAAGIPSPGGAANVDWLKLTKVGGNIGDVVLRLDTRAGQPPAGACTPGSAIVTSPYAAIYWTQTKAA